MVARAAKLDPETQDKLDNLFLKEEEPEDVALLNVLADIGGSSTDATVNVYRAGPNKQMAFLFSCHPAEFTLDNLRANYGGGDYRIHVRENGAIKANKFIKIEEPKAPSVFSQQAQAVQTQQNGGLEQLAAAMQQGFQQLAQMLVSVVQTQQTPVAPAVNPIELEDRFMNRMLVMKQLFAPAENSGGLGNAMEMFTKGIEIAKDFASEKGPGEASQMDVLLEALKTFGKPIAEAALSAKGGAFPQMGIPLPSMGGVAMGQNPAQLSRPLQPAQVHAPATAPAIPAPQQPQQSAPPEFDQMMKYINFLVEQAKAGKDPLLYADLILDNLPEDQVRELLGDPTLLDKAAMMVPEIATHRAWFDQLKQHLADALNETPQMLYTPPIGISQIPAGGITNAPIGQPDIDPTAHS